MRAHREVQAAPSAVSTPYRRRTANVLRPNRAHDAAASACGSGYVSGAPNAEAKRARAARHCLAEFISNSPVGF